MKPESQFGEDVILTGIFTGIQIAAQLLLVNINNTKTPKEYLQVRRSQTLQTHLDYIPPSLLIFSRTLLQGKKELEDKIASLGNDKRRVI